MGDESGKNAARRERVIGGVIARINAAPSPLRQPSVAAVIAAWRLPVLAAATLVVVASSAALLTTTRRDNETVLDSLGFPSPIAQYLATGQADVWSWLQMSGGER
jgi:hypothetical protein